MLLSTADTARRLDITPAHVRYLANKGKLPVKRTLSGVRVFKSEDVDALAAERRVSVKADD